MDNQFKKILIINNLAILAIIFFVIYFDWIDWKPFRRPPVRRVVPIVVPHEFGSSVSLDFLSPYLERFGVLSDKAVLGDPVLENAGEVQISLNKKSDGLIEVSWPKDYQIYSLVLKDLGPTKEITDNKIIFGFTTDKPPARLFPKAGPVVIERTKLEPPAVIDASRLRVRELLPGVSMIPSQEISPLKKGQRYAVEALFEKEGEDKIYAGLFGFRY